MYYQKHPWVKNWAKTFFASMGVCLLTGALGHYVIAAAFFVLCIGLLVAAIFKGALSE